MCVVVPGKIIIETALNIKVRRRKISGRGCRLLPHSLSQVPGALCSQLLKEKEQRKRGLIRDSVRDGMQSVYSVY